MKRFYSLLILLFGVLCTLMAHDVVVNGIYYNLDNTNKTAKVTYKGISGSSEKEYSGSVIIPSSITYNSEIYSVTSIGADAFYECSNLQNLTIADSITSIGEDAFYNCDSLCNVIIPDTITSIGDCAFWNCESLQNFKISNNVDYIGRSAFASCNNLKTITIGNNVEHIDEGAFSDSTSLHSITIGKNVGYIYDYAFYECYSLSDVYYKGTKAQWNEIYIGDYGNYSLQDATIHYNSHNLVRVSYTKATLAKNGVVVSKCTDCDYKKTTVIYYPKTFSFSPAACTYNGKVQTPAVIIKDANGKTISGNTFAVVSYDENGETYECAIKPQRASDKAILNMLIKALNA